MPTGTQLATAFDGPLEPAKTSLLYRLAIVPVFCAMLLMPVVYVALIVTAVAGVVWYTKFASVMFAHVPPGRAMFFVFVAFAAPLIAGCLLILFMILPFFWRSRKTDRPLRIDRREQPLLYAYVERLCDAMRAPRPSHIDVTALANASAHIDNGLFGVINRRLVLTIGLPLVQAMDLRQFTGVLAHELGHFTQGASMRLSYIVHRINRCFVLLAYGRSGVDDMIARLMTHDPHWSMALVGFLTQLMLWITRLVLMLFALICHFLCMHLSRQAEFDADRRASRIVGGEVLGDALQVVPFIGCANKLGFERARVGWARRNLPDDLVVLTCALHHAMPARLKDTITASYLTKDASWSDTHPPLFKRVAALKKAGARGVLKLEAPAACLFKDYDELCKVATLDVYHAILGPSLQPEHLFPTPAVIQTETIKSTLVNGGRGL